MYQQSGWEIINFSSKHGTRIYHRKMKQKDNQEVRYLAVHTTAYDALKHNYMLRRPWHQKYLYFQGASKLPASFSKVKILTSTE